MVRLNLPWPPSTNKTWRRSRSHMHLSKKTTMYRVAVRSLVLGAKISEIPLRGQLEVSVTLCPPDRKRRDEDNFAGKALFDALTKAGVWGDDSQIRRKIVEWGDVVKGGCVVVEISSLDQTRGA
ncbi:MAG: RusA family crossover junction endodeoxyribonuclease [Desulfomicrobium sp.]